MQPVVRDDELELLGALADPAVHAQHAIAAKQQRVDGIRHRVQHAFLGDVDMLVDLGRHVGDDQQAGRAAVAHGNRLGADRRQHVVLGCAGKCGRVALHQDRGDRSGSGQTLLEPANTEACHRGQEEQHLSEEYESDGQQQQLGRQAARKRNRTVRLFSGKYTGIGCFSHAVLCCEVSAGMMRFGLK
jgi:hypothetical protein